MSSQHLLPHLISVIKKLNNLIEATIQTIRDQQQLLIQQHQQSSHTKSDSMSDTGDGSFGSNQDDNPKQIVSIK